MKCPDCTTPMEYQDASDLTSGVLGKTPRENIVRCVYFCFECGTYWDWSPFHGLERWVAVDVTDYVWDERLPAEVVDDALKEAARLHITRELRSELDELTEEVA